MTLCKSDGRMITGEHDIQNNAERVNIRTVVCLSQAVLLRCSIPCGSEHNSVGRTGRFLSAGSVKINQDGLVSAQNDILGLHITVDRSEAVKNPQGVT